MTSLSSSSLIRTAGKEEVAEEQQQRYAHFDEVEDGGGGRGMLRRETPPPSPLLSGVAGRDGTRGAGGSKRRRRGRGGNGSASSSSFGTIMRMLREGISAVSTGIVRCIPGMVQTVASLFSDRRQNAGGGATDLSRNLFSGMVSSGFVVDTGGRRFRLGETIAEGAFSYVHKAWELTGPDNGEAWAAKKILLRTPEARRNAQREVTVHNAVASCGGEILRMEAHTFTRVQGKAEDVAVFIFPLYRRGTLQDALRSRFEAAASPTSSASLTASRTNIILALFLAVCQSVLTLHEKGYSHNDLNPRNILMSDGAQGRRANSGVMGDLGIPVLMDLGSAMPLPSLKRGGEGSDASIERLVTPLNRSDALTLQDWAARNCSAAFRAPELYDVREDGTRLDGSNDVWALGCILFAMAFGGGYSPFECTFGRDGNRRFVDCSLLRVIGRIPFPPNVQSALAQAKERQKTKEGHFEVGQRRSDEGALIMAQLVKWILQQEPSERPSLSTVIQRIEGILRMRRGRTRHADHAHSSAKDATEDLFLDVHVHSGGVHQDLQ